MINTVSRISVAEFCECEGIKRSVLVELVQYDIARPVAGSSSEEWEFDASSAHWMKRAIRLQRDLDLDWVATAMLIDLLRDREVLRGENARLRQRLDRFLADD